MESKETKKCSTEQKDCKAQQIEMQASAKLRILGSGSITERQQGPPSESPHGEKSNILLPTFIEIV